MVQRYRYSMWDGTQDVPDVSPDDILDNLTDDLMNFGDLQHALRNLMQRGMRNQRGRPNQGLRDLLQQLRQQRRQQLDKFDLGSVFDDMKKKLEEIVEMEKNTLDRRLDEAMGNQQPRRTSGSEGDSRMASSSQSGQQQGGQSSRAVSSPGRPAAAGRSRASRVNAAASRASPWKAARNPAASRVSPARQGAPTPSSEFAEMLKNIANKKQDFLETLPDDVAGQVKELQNYEFMDPEAQDEVQRTARDR